jgi:FlaA1/EpsC-like NDP-sugar epimerase
MKKLSYRFESLIDPRKWLDLLILTSCFGLIIFFNENTLYTSPWTIGAIWLIYKFSFLATSSTYKTFWRYTTFSDFTNIASYMLIPDFAASTLMLLCGVSFEHTLLLSLFSFLGVGSLRYIKRFQFEHAIKKEIESFGKRTLIVGLDLHAQIFCYRAIKDRQLKMWPVLFLDLNANQEQRVIHHCPVYSKIEELKEICIRFKVQEIVISSASTNGENMTEVLKVARQFSIRPRILSAQGLESEDSKKFELFKDVDLNDLLSRDKVNVNTELISKELHNKKILITGAGGSIGSELCRQIMRMQPSQIILMDHSELNLYQIHKELSDAYPNQVGSIVPILADIKNKNSIEQVFEKYEVNAVYHAAAYKHVHLVEMNPSLGILNNVLGTMNLLSICEKFPLERFVLISSDKAVNPTSVMGATKRVCELLVTMSALKTKNKYCSVRFGNVLGSSGSFIPLLKQQVRNGGPVTITDFRMERYFMTIPEAVSLVLEASLISNPGDISVLKMGQPIKIVDIAKKIITLMGKTEDEIEIVFTGIRPGEKLFEELYLCGDEIETSHKDIVVLPKGDAFSYDINLSTVLSEIMRLCELAKVDSEFTSEFIHRIVNRHKRVDSKKKTNNTEVAAA